MSYVWFLIFCFVVWSVVFYPLLLLLNYILSVITAPISKHANRSEMYIYLGLFILYIYLNGFVGAYLYALIDYAAPIVNYPKWRLVFAAYFSLITYSIILHEVVAKIAAKNSRNTMLIETVMNRKVDGVFYKTMYYMVLSLMSLKANGFMYLFLTLSFYFSNQINHLYFGWPGKIEMLFRF